MDMYFPITGRIFIIVDKAAFDGDRVGMEIRRTAQALVAKGHSVFILTEEVLEEQTQVEEKDSVYLARLPCREVVDFFRVFKPAMVLSNQKDPGCSEALRLAKSLKLPSGEVPGSSNKRALSALSKCAFSRVNLVRNTREWAVETQSLIALGRDPHWITLPVDALIPHAVKGELVFSVEGDGNDKRACVCRVVFLDEQGEQIAFPYSGLAQSASVGAYTYLSAGSDEFVKLLPPKGAVQVKLGFQCWNAKNVVRLKSSVACVSLIPRSLKTSSSSQEQSRPAIELKELKVAAILDEFTTECFQPEVNLKSITPANWHSVLEADKPDLLFVESCWFGNSNTWSGLIFGYSSNGTNKMDELVNLIQYCKSEGIPTVFWAKEDPVHFSRFAPTAKLFDYVFTTDENMIPKYQELYGIEAQALSFFCQPRVHNPIQSIVRNCKAAFAGSYYADKQERCENFHTIMDALESAGIETDIYDRCFDRGLAHLTFPQRYAGKVIGNLKPEDMWKAYKGYRYTANLNTVKHSPTMFARRVYESLASGTPVISNYSEGVRTQFGGIVCASDCANDILEYLDKLSDENTYQAISRLGVREVLGRHTLADRLGTVCQRLGINLKPHLPIMNMEITAADKPQVEEAVRLFEAQTYGRKRLIVNLENSNVLYPYLNQNTDEIVFRVKTEFARDFDGLMYTHELGGELEDTTLEDVALVTQYENAGSVMKAKVSGVVA